MIIAAGFAEHARATALAAFGWPIADAISL
jgi:hypothetical protein